MSQVASLQNLGLPKLIFLTEGSDLPIYPKSPKFVLRNTLFECGQERWMYFLSIIFLLTGGTQGQGQC